MEVEHISEDRRLSSTDHMVNESLLLPFPANCKLEAARTSLIEK